MTAPIVEHEASKVHFSEGVGLNTSINVQVKSSSRVDVHVGFLLVNSTYEIQLKLPHPFGDIIQLKEPGRKFLLISCDASTSPDKGHKLKLKLTTRQEGKVKDRLIFSKNNDDDEIRLEMNIAANVIDKLRGTPMLKDGIHCVETHRNNESGNDTE